MGIVQQAMAEPPVEEDETTGPEAVTPEEQEAYEKVVLAGMKVIYDKSNTGNVVDRLKAGADTPAKTLADTAVMIMTTLDEQSQGTIPDAVIAHACDAIMTELAEVANKSKAFEVTDKVFGQARQMMLIGLSEQFGDDQEGMSQLMSKTDPEQAKMMAQEQAMYSQEEA
jgi:hypothetical protein